MSNISSSGSGFFYPKLPEGTPSETRIKYDLQHEEFDGRPDKEIADAVNRVFAEITPSVFKKVSDYSNMDEVLVTGDQLKKLLTKKVEQLIHKKGEKLGERIDRIKELAKMVQSGSMRKEEQGTEVLELEKCMALITSYNELLEQKISQTTSKELMPTIRQERAFGGKIDFQSIFTKIEHPDVLQDLKKAKIDQLSSRDISSLFDAITLEHLDQIRGQDEGSIVFLGKQLKKLIIKKAEQYRELPQEFSSKCRLLIVKLTSMLPNDLAAIELDFNKITKEIENRRGRNIQFTPKLEHAQGPSASKVQGFDKSSLERLYKETITDENAAELFQNLQPPFFERMGDFSIEQITKIGEQLEILLTKKFKQMSTFAEVGIKDWYDNLKNILREIDEGKVTSATDIIDRLPIIDVDEIKSFEVIEKCVQLVKRYNEALEYRTSTMMKKGPQQKSDAAEYKEFLELFEKKCTLSFDTIFGKIASEFDDVSVAQNQIVRLMQNLRKIHSEVDELKKYQTLLSNTEHSVNQKISDLVYNVQGAFGTLEQELVSINFDLMLGSLPTFGTVSKLPLLLGASSPQERIRGIEDTCEEYEKEFLDKKKEIIRDIIPIVAKMPVGNELTKQIFEETISFVQHEVKTQIDKMEKEITRLHGDCNFRRMYELENYLKEIGPLSIELRKMKESKSADQTTDMQNLYKKTVDILSTVTKTIEAAKKDTVKLEKQYEVPSGALIAITREIRSQMTQSLNLLLTSSDDSKSKKRLQQAIQDLKFENFFTTREPSVTSDLVTVSNYLREVQQTVSRIIKELRLEHTLKNWKEVEKELGDNFEEAWLKLGHLAEIEKKKLLFPTSDAYAKGQVSKLIDQYSLLEQELVKAATTFESLCPTESKTTRNIKKRIQTSIDTRKQTKEISSNLTTVGASVRQRLQELEKAWNVAEEHSIDSLKKTLQHSVENPRYLRKQFDLLDTMYAPLKDRAGLKRLDTVRSSWGLPGFSWFWS